ncbi:ribosome silencing factor [Terrimonas sp.]|uniref:ribosome silencing factor n=1 Tax=Terrimonas sp. TaxID=1914338 RepID=UPI000D5081AE|nr:ribosome silencing factor [Terrimonas sp.]PVD51110.1 ribosome silencing factor [Terrimonas sp.]
MTSLQVLSERPKRSARLTRNSKLFKTIINAIRNKKGENIISLDLRKVDEAVADFFIVCEASSNVQIKAIADAIQDEVKEKCVESPYRHEGYQALQWVLIDYVNIVVHIFQPETRKFYKLEEMWNDGEQVEHES